jgi:hypothetical protein
MLARRSGSASVKMKRRLNASGLSASKNPLHALLAHEPRTIQKPLRLICPRRRFAAAPTAYQMLPDGPHKRIHSSVIDQSRVVHDAPQTRFILDVRVEVVEKARHAEPELLAATDELQDLYQRARSDQVRFLLFGMHRLSPSRSPGQSPWGSFARRTPIAKPRD